MEWLTTPIYKGVTCAGNRAYRREQTKHSAVHEERMQTEKVRQPDRNGEIQANAESPSFIPLPSQETRTLLAAMDFRSRACRD